MSMFEIYLIMQLDSIKLILVLVSAISPLMLLVYAGAVCEFQPDKFNFKTMKKMCAVIVFLIVTATLTPTTKTAIAMVAGEKITNNPALIESADKGVKLLPKVIDAVDVYLNKKEQLK